MALIIAKDGENARKIDKSEFGKESYLQEFIHKNPESIPVYEIEEDKKLFVVAREFSTESGPIDALAVDKDGDIYVVETKLYKNSDKRTVVAQALDYGASLWRHSDYEEFLNKINSELNNKYPIGFEEKIKQLFKIDDEQVETMLEAIKRNLQNGNIKFVILMDTIDERLKDLIVYINQNSRFDIYAVQMEYYKFESYEIMIPKLFGIEVKKDAGVSKPARLKWDEERFFKGVRNPPLTDIEINAIKTLYDFSKKEADDIGWGTGNVEGSFSPKFSTIAQRSLYTVSASGTLSLNLGWLNGSEKEKLYRDEFKKGIEELEISDIPPDYFEKRYIPIEAQRWTPKVNDIIKLVRRIKLSSKTV